MFYTALIGYPTKQSLSNKLFQIYADSVALEYSHIKIDISPQTSSLSDVTESLKKLNFSGFNITIPYKMAIIELLDEVDNFSEQIGAVNTVRIRNNILTGSNTDHIGALRSIENALKRKVQSCDEAVVFGTGGAAKAVVGGLLKYTNKVTVIYRCPQSLRTKDFIERFSDKVSNIFPINSAEAKSKILSANLICNATSVGMTPNISQSIFCFDIKELRDKRIERVFFDVVYNPLHTTFLRQAIEEGYLIADGLDMMIYQAEQAFKIWTDIDISESTVKRSKSLITG